MIGASRQKDEASMGQHVRSSFRRTVAVVVAAVSVAGGVLSASPAQAQPEDAAAPAPQREPGAAPESAAAEPRRPAASPAPAQKASRADCERRARALAGKEKDAELPQKAAAGSTAMRNANADLVTCLAVLADSDEPCKRLDDESADNCRRDRAAFHELRAYPNGKSFMLDDRKFEECKQNAAMAPVCTALRNALRSGDPSQCVLEADFEKICRTAGDLDVSKCATEAPELKRLLEGQCRALVTLDESACDLGGPRGAEMAKQCRDDVKAGKAYGKGLKELASSGSDRQKALAKAALKEADACEALTKSAVDACLEGEAAPALGAVDPPPPAPAPEADAPPGGNPPPQ
jgi:hypothetical protein